MYAIIKTGGAQFRVEPGMKVLVPSIDGEAGAPCAFEDVLLVAKDEKVVVGRPLVEGVRVTAKIIKHTRGPKVTIYKRKRRKGYEKKTGHRQNLTWVEIEKIVKG
ncbi:50S ribosomal protein L21 [Candidatus Fermentibacteria bacterium]|nr:MAG: 50S ribosomal protein L21 [Candidatus Fermentibacteria bacterium]